jgi:hypothetical protein
MTDKQRFEYLNINTDCGSVHVDIGEQAKRGWRVVGYSAWRREESYDYDSWIQISVLFERPVKAERDDSDER